MDIEVTRIREAHREAAALRSKETLVPVPLQVPTLSQTIQIPADEAAILDEFANASTPARAQHQELLDSATQEAPPNQKPERAAALSTAEVLAVPLTLSNSTLTVLPAIDAPSSTNATLEQTNLRNVFSLPGFETVELLGKGGLCEVYLIKQRYTGALFAAKTLLPEANCVSGIERLREEAAKINAVRNNKDIPLEIKDLFPVVAFERLGDSRYTILVEYVPKTFRSWLDSHPSIDAVLECYLDIANGVEALHNTVGIHGDIKPEALGFGANDRVKFIDLNLKWTDERFAHVKSLVHSIDQADQERLKKIQGTAPYMAPEQWEGRADVRTDVFQLSLLLEDMLSHFDKTFPELKSIIDKGRARKPEARYPSVKMLIAAVEAAHAIVSPIKGIPLPHAIQSIKTQVDLKSATETSPLPSQLPTAKFKPQVSSRLLDIFEGHGYSAETSNDSALYDKVANCLRATKTISFSDLEFILERIPKVPDGDLRVSIDCPILDNLLSYKRGAATYSASIMGLAPLLALALDKVSGDGKVSLIPRIKDAIKQVLDNTKIKLEVGAGIHKDTAENEIMVKVRQFFDAEFEGIRRHLAQEPAKGLVTLYNEYCNAKGWRKAKARDFLISITAYVENCTSLSLSDLLYIVSVMPRGIKTEGHKVHRINGNDKYYWETDVYIIAVCLNKIRDKRGTYLVPKIKEQIQDILTQCKAPRGLMKGCRETTLSQLEQIRLQHDAS